MDQIIEISEVTKKFQLFWEDIVIFDKINLEIERNELVLFYGPSGSGKTTLLNLLTGLLLPDEGEIQVAGLNLDLIPEKDKADYRSNYLGIVFQENNLVSTLTVTENIVLFQELCEYESENKQERIDELLTKLGIDHRKDSFPAQLSGGEKKRVAIARALSTNPYLLILDEPTGNLDRESVDDLCNLIKELFLTTDITIIVSSHDQKMNEIATKVYKVGSKQVQLEVEYPTRKKGGEIKYRSIGSLERGKEDFFEDEMLIEEDEE
ncbi:MAG: ABC transporter ATP-binding protein [Candidatus Heimdallarchaeaceae archaeon]